MSLIWNPFKVWLLNSCVSLISLLKTKMAWETITEKEPNIEKARCHVSPWVKPTLNFKPKHPYIAKAILSPDLWDHHHHNNSDNNNNNKNTPSCLPNQKSLFELSGGVTLMVICWQISLTDCREFVLQNWQAPLWSLKARSLLSCFATACVYWQVVLSAQNWSVCVMKPIQLAWWSRVYF